MTPLEMLNSVELNTIELFKDRIEKRLANIGIIGLGYVGLPLGVEFAAAGFPVTGFEVDDKKIQFINGGSSYINDVASDRMRPLVEDQRLSATGDFQELSKMDAIIICVPTPLRKTKDPDISYIVSAVEQVKRNLRKGQLVILESTTYPGTTREVVLPMLQETGLRIGEDFCVAFSPERVDPGNKRFGIKNTPKIIGGITPVCAEMAGLLYSTIVDRIHPVSSTEAAEMVKLLENTFRSVNIGLVNEVALMCDRLKLDTWEVIDAAATKPFGFMPFYPGPGLGGHCIPLDPHYLSWKLKALNFYARFIELAGEINSHMPEFLLEKIIHALNERAKPINGSKVLLLGVAYKKDIADVRESPALDVINLLLEKKALVSYHDPYVPSVSAGDREIRNSPLTDGLIKEQDCVVITTDHSCFDMRRVVEQASLVVDSRNATRGIRDVKILKI